MKLKLLVIVGICLMLVPSGFLLYMSFKTSSLFGWTMVPVVASAVLAGRLMTYLEALEDKNVD